QVSLCVAVQPTHASVVRGKVAQWTVSAWTQGGNVPHAIISLAAAPASLKPKYSVGCGSHDGTALCDLGAIDVKAAKREVQAQGPGAEREVGASPGAAHRGPPAEAAEGRRDGDGSRASSWRRRTNSRRRPSTGEHDPAFRRLPAVLASLRLHAPPGRQRGGPVPHAQPRLGSPGKHAR